MDLDDDYECIKKKPLNLTANKGSSGAKKSKKKPGIDPLVGVSEAPKVIVPTMTEAERAFKAKQDKIAHKRILQKASKTHKQRVEEFNKHLDSLSEHYDIPKVSWTK